MLTAPGNPTPNYDWWRSPVRISYFSWQLWGVRRDIYGETTRQKFGANSSPKNPKSDLWNRWLLRVWSCAMQCWLLNCCMVGFYDYYRLDPIIPTSIKHLEHHKHPEAITHQSTIQQQYWINADSRLIKFWLSHCLMGNLSKFRLQPVKSIITTGVSYDGPIALKVSTTRRTKPCQTIICTTTKALHF